VSADARFCPSCGHPLHAPGDERRVVTVVFGDLVGFTGLSEGRDPEQVKNVVDRCFAALAEDIRSFGGTLDKVVGDALVALFGAPVAHEDDAERAVRAALQMQRTLASTASSLGIAVEMRIGVNTGEVLVGALRAGGDYTAMGDVVNTASRLETMAEPGRVVVGPDTYAATSDVFRYEPLGLVQPRGREAGVEAWIAHEAMVEPGRRLRRRATRLVGRDPEAALLEHLVVTAFERRRPTMALLLGEAGVGKSRLAEEVMLRVLGHFPARVLSGRAVPYGAANAWWPVAEVIRSACGIVPEDSEDQARAKATAAVADLLGAEPGSDESIRVVEALLYLAGMGRSLADVATDRAQDDVARGTRAFIEALAERQPLVITLGDMQWAESMVLSGLEELLGKVRRVPLVVLLTARPEVLDAWRPRGGHDNLVVLNLEPLDVEASTELLVSLLGSDPGPAVRDELVERSGGNPLFLEELAALVADDEGGAGLRALPALPATLRGIVAARLDALPTRERAVLDDAAVVGRRAPIATLLALGGSRGTVHEVLADLAAHDLLVVEEGQWEFRSDLVREVVYGMLTKAERARRHATLAQWLDRLPGAPTDELLGERARHWSTAAELDAELGGIDTVPTDVRDRAVEALQAAVARATDRELHAVAWRWADRLARLLGDESSAARRRALVARARAATALRRDQEAVVDLDEAEADSRAAGDEEALGEALVVRGDALRNRGDYDGSLAALEEARRLLQRIGDRRGEGAALRRIGWTLLFAGEMERAEPVLREALAAFEEAGALRGQAWAHQNLAWVAYGRADAAAVEERLNASEALFRQIGDFAGLNWATGMRGWLAMSQGHLVEAEGLAARTLTEAEEQDDRWQVGMMTVLFAMIRLAQGHLDDAIALAREARQRFASIGDHWGEVRAMLPLARALLLAGRFDEAAAVQIDPLAEALGFVVLGDGERALGTLGDGPIAGDRRMDIGDLVAAQALAFVQVGRAGEAVDALTAHAEEVAGGPRAHVLAVLALARAASGAWADARRRASESLALGGVYTDRALALMVEACAAAHDGDAAAVRAAVDGMTRLVSATQDRVTAAVVALAGARALAAVGDPFARGAEADARRRLDTLGIDAIGWDRAFRLATGAAGASAPA